MMFKGDERWLKEPRWTVDWVRVIGNLQATGMSLAEIADAVFVVRQSISNYLNPDTRADPTYGTGMRLLALWVSKTGCNPDDVPMFRRPMSVSAILKAHR